MQPFRLEEHSFGEHCLVFHFCLERERDRQGESYVSDVHRYSENSLELILQCLYKLKVLFKGKGYFPGLFNDIKVKIIVNSEFLRSFPSVRLARGLRLVTAFCLVWPFRTGRGAQRKVNTKSCFTEGLVTQGKGGLLKIFPSPVWGLQYLLNSDSLF